MAEPRQKRVAEIIDCEYRVYDISCEPSEAEISEAIQKGELEPRSFQKDIHSLNDEWNRNANNRDEYCDFQRRYHTQRIAYLAVYGWPDPIRLRSDGTVDDGSHRLKAAKYMRMEMIDVIIPEVQATQ